MKERDIEAGQTVLRRNTMRDHLERDGIHIRLKKRSSNGKIPVGGFVAIN